MEATGLRNRIGIIFERKKIILFIERFASNVWINQDAIWW